MLKQKLKKKFYLGWISKNELRNNEFSCLIARPAYAFNVFLTSVLLQSLFFLLVQNFTT